MQNEVVQYKSASNCFLQHTSWTTEHLPTLNSSADSQLYSTFLQCRCRWSFTSLTHHPPLHLPQIYVSLMYSTIFSTWLAGRCYWISHLKLSLGQDKSKERQQEGREERTGLRDRIPSKILSIPLNSLRSSVAPPGGRSWSVQVLSLNELWGKEGM